ncbi:hypothetical protein [Lignipirellula cremea]|uniref:hypothetical protein n=1 Tax=Lignipirellula cremea TaxID=2528010 RepID=UPI0011A4EB66|nr:hypothetical protein [Lignipirellula cremea]
MMDPKNRLDLPCIRPGVARNGVNRGYPKQIQDFSSNLGQIMGNEDGGVHFVPEADRAAEAVALLTVLDVSAGP